MKPQEDLLLPVAQLDILAKHIQVIMDADVKEVYSFRNIPSLAYCLIIFS